LRAGRLAPTPSGELHLGNLTAFYAAWLSARQSGARLLLRMEDVDTGRSRPDVEARQREILHWFGIDWDEETPRQSERDYTEWIDALGDHAYRCACSRKELRAAGGLCGAGCATSQRETGALRFVATSKTVRVYDRRHGPSDTRADLHHHPILVRGDGLVAYPLAVVVDDIRDGVTEVVRGDDLLSFSAPQEQLWRALGATPPSWLHTPLILGADGRKLSKSHGSVDIAGLRNHGWQREDLRSLVGSWLGVPTANLAEAVSAWRPSGATAGAVHVLTGGEEGPSGLSWRTGPLE
jgi:glutamyl/glutaminyl-tRNA synthetase